MIILGVDPGTIHTGYGIVKLNSNKLSLVESGVLNIPANLQMGNKLELIHKTLDNLIKKLRPDEFAIETAFYGKNVQSAMKIGYARGVSLLAATQNNVPASEYSPREIKKAVTGTGAASKEQVSFMVHTLLNLKNKMKFDESDALAIALCHSFRIKTPVAKAKSWKSFIEAFPERVIDC